MSESPKKQRSDEELEQLRQQHQYEQNVPFMCDFYAVIWWRLFEELKGKGFTESQSLDLIKAFIQKPS